MYIQYTYILICQKIFQLYVLTVWIGTYSMKMNIQSMNLSEVIINNCHSAYQIECCGY